MRLQLISIFQGNQRLQVITMIRQRQQCSKTNPWQVLASSNNDIFGTEVLADPTLNNRIEYYPYVK